MVVQNVASAATIAEVFETGMPLVERVVTVTGGGVRRPGNYVVPVGTKLDDVLAFCGGLTDDAREIVFGGPMMGVAQARLDVPLVKGTTGVVVLTEADLHAEEAMACIRCGRCLDACPVYLNPSLLGQLARKGRYEDMEAAHLKDCMLCGCCSYVCPSRIPLSQLFQVGRSMAQAAGREGRRRVSERPPPRQRQPAPVGAPLDVPHHVDGLREPRAGRLRRGVVVRDLARCSSSSPRSAARARPSGSSAARGRCATGPRS